MKSLTRVILVLSLLIPFRAASADGNVLLQATFETGQVQRSSSETDGLWIGTLPDPQPTGDDYVKSGSGGFGPNTNWDTRVVSQETLGSEIIRPRNGDFFLRSSIYLDKDYLQLNNGSRDKPRSIMSLTTEAQRFDFDEEIWLGFSIYLPATWEHEQGINDHRGAASLVAINARPSASLLALMQYVPKNSEHSHWMLRFATSDNSATEGGDGERETIYLDLGSSMPDLGKWTDFVIRVRSNPFSTTTNPYRQGIPNSRDQSYEGNRGILQVWKSEGESREKKLKVDLLNRPIGLVPHATEHLRIQFQIYKYGWRVNPTTVKGPVWVGFDEIRYGITDKHGTGYTDVDPSNFGRSLVGAEPLAPKIDVE